MPAKLQFHTLQEKSLEDLKVELGKVKNSLAELRIFQASKQQANKLGHIKQTRKNIARIMHAISLKTKDELRKFYETKGGPLPKFMRPKATRRQRMALTLEQRTRMTPRDRARAHNWKLRRFAILEKA